VRSCLILATIGVVVFICIDSNRAMAQAAPAVESGASDPAVTPAAIARGRVIFNGSGNCLMCHGAKLEGGAGPALTAHAWKDAIGGSYAAIFGVVTNGVSGTAMLALPGGITSAQAQQVAAYVWAVSHGKAKA
jgi:mono/diheme cytochrome c family protein